MERQQRKKIDATAKDFIVWAYRIGISVLLIDKFLRESDWDCTVAAVYDALWDKDIRINDYNCSSDSLIWRRYLTNILETSGVLTYEQFEEIALDEARNYYDVNLIMLMEYWYDFNKFTAELKSPPDPAWIKKALHYFGFNFTWLVNKLNKENISITLTELCNIYDAHIQGGIFDIDERKLQPTLEPTLAIKHFWRSSHQIGIEVDKFIEWTEIFTGTSAKEEIINFTLTFAP